MDPMYSLQDVIWCDLCETRVPQKHCYTCNKNLCKTCEEEHLSDSSKVHRFVPFRFRRSISKCQKHSLKMSECFCEQCAILICGYCASSNEHRDHKISNVVEKLEGQNHVLQNDMQEIEKSIYPQYRECASCILIQISDLKENSQKLTTAENKHKEEYSHLNALNKQEVEIRKIISDIEQCAANIKKLMTSNDVIPVCAYKSRNAEFRKKFGSLSAVQSTYLDRPLVHEQCVISYIKTKYRVLSKLIGVCCLSDEQIWTCGYNDITMRLYNLQGEPVESIKTKSEAMPWDIALTGTKDLVYTDIYDRTVNIVKDTQIQTVVKLRKWLPHNICCTSSGDILVVLISCYEKPTKVVRYSGSTEKQCIQFDDKGQPLHSSGYTKYICENRNQDICVSDTRAHAVVVVNQAGKLRFTYTDPSTTKRQFTPRGITTDSQGRILIAARIRKKYYIHIIDQDGQFLRCIDNCDLFSLSALCVDSRDNLLVAEYNSGKVKKIQYCCEKKRYQALKKLPALSLN